MQKSSQFKLFLSGVWKKPTERPIIKVQVNPLKPTKPQLKKRGGGIDTHRKKSVFFSGRTTKSLGRVNPPDHQAKTTFFSKIRLFKPQNGEEKEKIVKIRFRLL